MNYYLGPWRWVTDSDGSYFAPPPGTSASIDLRSDLGELGLGFFACQSLLLDLSYVELGTSLGQRLSSSQLAAWRSSLHLTKLASTRLLDVLVETLTIRADPLSIARAKPIIPCRNGRIQVALQEHGIVWEEAFEGESDEKWPNIQVVLHANYRKVREQALLDGAHTHQRLLARWMEKYGIDDPRVFIPEDLPVEAANLPHTTYTDDFNRGNSDSLGADWTEVDGDWDIVSNTVRAPVDANASTYPSSARYEHDLSSDDHYAEVDWVYAAVDTAYVGPACRFAAAAETCYAGFVRENAGYRYIGKIVAGTWTGLVNDTSGTAPPHTVKLMVNGSTLTLYDDGARILQTTDTSITGNLRIGLIAHSTATGGGDNFESKDLVSTVWLIGGAVLVSGSGDVYYDRYCCCGGAACCCDCYWAASGSGTVVAACDETSAYCTEEGDPSVECSGYSGDCTYNEVSPAVESNIGGKASGDDCDENLYIPTAFRYDYASDDCTAP